MQSNLAVNFHEDRQLPDVQNLPDNRQLEIQQVGIKNITAPMTFIDLNFERQQTNGKFNLYVSLDQKRKATHMSRLVEIILAYSNSISLENIHEILLETKSRLLTQTAQISIAFTYFLYKEAPASGLVSPVDYKVKLSGTINERNFTDLFVEVEVPVTTVCPCSKEISARGAHNQRGRVTVKVKIAHFYSVMEIIKTIEKAASCEIYGLLKRKDEKYVTERAYDNPRFVEDLVREVALRLQKVGHFPWFSVEAENFESIHNHSAYAFMETKNLLPLR